mgnify:CR=1 FL=1
MASIKFLDRPLFRARYKTVSFLTARIKNKNQPRVRIQESLPFRIRFTTIGVPGYGPPGFPGIGIQVIGYNNYIL